MTHHIHAWHIEYIICIVGVLILAYLFFRAKDGWLRKHFIAYLLSIAFVTGFGLFAYIYGFEDDKSVMTMAFIPWTIESVAFIGYMLMFHRRNVPERLEPKQNKKR